MPGSKAIIQGTGCKKILGIVRHRWLILRPAKGPLPMQFILCPWDVGVLHIQFRWSLPATESGAKSQPNQALKSTHQQVSNRNNKCHHYPKRKRPSQNYPDSPLCLDYSAPCHGKTMGDREYANLSNPPNGTTKGVKQACYNADMRSHGKMKSHQHQVDASIIDTITRWWSPSLPVMSPCCVRANRHK